MNHHRHTGRTAGSTTRWIPSGRSSREAVRSGTVLRVVRGLLAGTTWVAALASSLPGAEVGTGNQGGFSAGFLTPGAIGAQGHPQAGPHSEALGVEALEVAAFPVAAVPAAALQPVSIQGPEGMTVSVETSAGWSDPAAAPFRTTLLVGSSYRVRIGGIRGYEGLEVYPTLRILARLATPPGMDRRFPVEIAIDESDLVTALEGGHVERIVYMACDPDMADVSAVNWFDVHPGDDPRDVASTLGAPVAEVVLGNRLPPPGVVP